jgi:hypothetical protein
MNYTKSFHDMLNYQYLQGSFEETEEVLFVAA